MDSLFKFTKTASAALQNKINNSVIFNYLRENGSISRMKISRDLKISPPVVSRAMVKLIQDGYVIETKKAKTKKGKWPMMLKVNKDKGFVLGIDLGKERFKMALANYNCQIVKKHKGFKIFDDANIAEKVASEMERFLAQMNTRPQAVYIGLPAAVDFENGDIIRAPLYGSWKNLNLKQALEDRFSFPVYIENDVKLSSLGEKNYGSGKDFSDMVFVEISNGIGAGIILDNNLLRGSHGSAGEIGFHIIGDANLGFKIKNKGFLEKFASVDGLKKQMVKAIREGKQSSVAEKAGGDLEKIDPNMICLAAAEGDQLAGNLIEKMNRFLAVSIINLILIIDPQIIFLGGDISRLPHAKQLFVKPIKSQIKNTLPFQLPQIKLPTLGEDAGIVGACYMAIESIIANHFPYKIEKEVLA